MPITNLFLAVVHVTEYTIFEITLYTATPYEPGTPGCAGQTSRENFVCELYMLKMNGYKPPKQPE